MTGISFFYKTIMKFREEQIIFCERLIRVFIISFLV